MNRVLRKSSNLAYYYSVLGVSSEFSKKEIKAAFLEKAVEHHPGFGLKVLVKIPDTNSL